jgi:phage terminase small subunit
MDTVARRASMLTPRQQLFAIEYLNDLNATQAAIRAGYSQKTARKQGSRLFCNPALRAVIESAQQRILQRAEIDAEAVIREAAAIAFVDPTDIFDAEGRILPFDQMSERGRRAATAFEFEELTEAESGEVRCIVRRVQIAYRLAALKWLAKLLRADDLKTEVMRAIADSSGVRTA